MLQKLRPAGADHLRAHLDGEGDDTGGDSEAAKPKAWGHWLHVASKGLGVARQMPRQRRGRCVQ